jgi:hypothetical protein
MRKKLIEWCDQPERERVYYLWSKKELQVEAGVRIWLEVPARASSDTVLLQLLVNDDIRNGASGLRDPRTTLKERLLRNVLSRSHLKSLSGKAKESTRIGHAIEVKTRTTASTAQAERLKIRGGNKYVRIKYSDRNFL